MTTLPLSETQLINLTLLLTVRDALALDRAAACCRYDVDAALADRLAGLNAHQVLAFVEHVGDTVLFPPRQDLAALLDAPLPLMRPLAVARSTRTARAQAET